MNPTSKILIVDDDPGARDILEALLLPEDYDLEFASNGAEALEKAAALMPSLILLDVMMPGMDGFEVCQRLRSNPLLSEIPVIMLTALDERDSRLRGIEVGADDFISKPFDRGELRARVGTITRLDRYRRLLLERTKFEWVIQQAADGYLIVDKNDTILYANPQTRLFLGLPPEKPEEKKDQENHTEIMFLELARKQYTLEPQEAWMNWLDSSSDITLTPRYLVRPETSTSNAFWLQVDVLQLSPDIAGNRVLRLRDVTTQIISQRNLRGFHTMIHHKLRTPLVGILGSLEFLMKYAPTLSSDDLFKFSKMAWDSAKRLHGEIEDILQYLDVPHLLRAKEGFALSQFSAIVSRISSNLEIAPISITGLEEVNKLWIHPYQKAIELMLWEILENSKKFHPNQTPIVQIDIARADAKYISITILDDGITLAPQQLEYLWTPYYQGEKHLTGEGKGMGLGLATVASLVWEVGGICRAYNRDDRAGVAIELLLPYEELPEEDIFDGK